MDGTAHSLPTTRRFRNWRSWIGIAFAAFFLLGLTLYATWRISNTVMVNRLKEQARLKNEPLTIADLKSRQPVLEDSNNAAVALMALWEKEDPEFWQAFRDGTQPPRKNAVKYHPDLPVLGPNAVRIASSNRWSPANLAQAEKFLSAHAESIREATLALQRSGCVFPIKMEDGLQALLPHLAKLQQLAQTYELQAHVHIERAEAEAALRAIRDQLQVVRTLNHEPLVISQLIRGKCLSRCADSAYRLIQRHQLNPEQLTELQNHFRETSVTNALILGLRGDRAMLNNVFEGNGFFDFNLAGELKPQDPKRRTVEEQHGLLGFMRLSGITTYEQRVALTFCEKTIAFLQTNGPADLTEDHELFRPLARNKNSRWLHPISSFWLQPYSLMGHPFGEIESQRLLLLTALAVEHYRLAHQTTPPDLASLVPTFLPKVFMDPFDHLPLRYRRESQGYLIYSVGRDRRDQNGRENKRAATSSDYDIIFRIPR